MKFSDSTDYLAYIDAKARGDLSGALRALHACLSTEEFRRDRIQHAHLLQTIGDVYFEYGDRVEARRSYEKAEAVDPNSLFFKHNFAVFLLEKISDKPAALKRCEEIIESGEANPTRETDKDFGSDKYVQLAKRLAERIKAA